LPAFISRKAKPHRARERRKHNQEKAQATLKLLWLLLYHKLPPQELRSAAVAAPAASQKMAHTAEIMSWTIPRRGVIVKSSTAM
jgi:hypothetical protein